MTPEEKLNQTVATIEKAIEDVSKNKATKSEVVSLIDDKVKDDKEAIKTLQQQTAEVKSKADQLKEDSDNLKTQLRSIQAGGYSALRSPSGSYRGFFSSPQEAKAFGLMLMAAGTANSNQTKTQHDKVLKSLERMGIEPVWVSESGFKTMTGVSQTGGSALVTIEQTPSFIQLLQSYGVFRRNAQNVPMAAGSTTTPKIDTLLTGYCPGEGGEITAADPTIAVLTMVPKAICFLTGYSIELDEDSAIGIAELLGPLFARSMAYYEDLCGFLGDGTSTYFGFKGITGALRAVNATIANIKSLVVGSDNIYSGLVIGDFEGVVGKLPVFDNIEDMVKWFVHRYFYYTVMVKLAFTSTYGATATEVMTGAGSRQKTFLGYPVEFTQVMPSAEANSQICALFGNLSLGCMLGTRGGIEFAQSSERYFEKGIIAVRGRDRIAINAHGVGDTTKAGPIIGLITAAS